MSNKVIYKYILEGKTEQFLTLPMGARVLSVALQSNNIVVYAMINPDQLQRENLGIFVYGTGHDTSKLPPAARFLGTVALYDGNLMFHVFIDDATRLPQN